MSGFSWSGAATIAAGVLLAALALALVGRLAG
jgi:hypothetical protein